MTELDEGAAGEHGETEIPENLRLENSRPSPESHTLSGITADDARVAVTVKVFTAAASSAGMSPFTPPPSAGRPRWSQSLQREAARVRILCILEGTSATRRHRVTEP